MHKICQQCGKEGKRFFVETFPCKCGEHITIEYFTCDPCCNMWRACDGQVISEPDMIITQDMEDLEILDNIIQKAIDDPNFLFSSDSEPTCMSDMIVRCLMCNELASEVGDGIYMCTNKSCLFKWETLNG